MLILNKPLIDWITLTSWDERAYAFFQNNIDEQFTRKKKDEAKRMQYVGYQNIETDGSIFLGSSIIKGRGHDMMQVSGAAADRLFPPLSRCLVEGWAKATRIDIQITTELPASWRQWGLFNRIKKRGYSAGWVESQDRNGNELSTVYCGSRKSASFSRTYIKKAERGKLLLRFEVQYQKGKSNNVAREIARNPDRVGEYLKTELFKTDELLTNVFLPFLTIYADGQKVKETRPESNTEAWLIDTVLPVFNRMINQHDADGYLMAMFQQAIDHCQKTP